MRHLVADAVGAPAERQLGEIARADDEAAVQVGPPEGMARALAALHVLEADVVDRPAPGVRMADVLQHLQARGPDIDFLGAGPYRAHQLPCLVARAAGGGEARHGVGEDVAPRQLQLVERARADEQRLGRVEPAGDADDQLPGARRLHAGDEALHLDAVHLLAAQVAARRVPRNVREAADAALERQAPPGQRQRELHAAEPGHLGRVAARAFGKGVLPHAVGEQPVEIDVGERELRGGGEALRFGKQGAVLVDDRVAVPGEIGGGLADARRAVQVGRQAARRLVGGQLVAIALLADDDVRRGEIADDAGAGERRERGGRRWHPQVLADLYVQDESRHLGEAEQQVGAEGGVLPGQRDRAARAPVAGRELARLVELAVVRQVGLRHDADQPPAAEERRAVVEAAVDRHRQADQRGERQVARAREKLRERVLGGVDQRALVEQIVAGVGGKAKLGEHGEQRLVARGLLHELERRVGVVPGIADAHARRRHRDAREAVTVQVEEIVAGRHLQAILAHPGYGMLSHMLLLSEKVLLGDALLEIELHDDLRYRLRYGGLVEHQNGRRRVRGRSAAYEFRSVEQLRYDFERDVEAALGRLG